MSWRLDKVGGRERRRMGQELKKKKIKMSADEEKEVQGTKKEQK